MARLDKYLSGGYTEGDYWVVDPSSKGNNWYTDQAWNKYINQVGHRADQLVDLNKRSYKTMWLDPNEYQHSTKWGRNFTTPFGGKNFVDLHGEQFTGRQRTNIDEWNRYNEDNRWRGYGGWQRNEHEIIDWGAYNRDALYARALQERHGRNQFKTLQDIWDAEDVMAGKWSKPAPPPPPPAAPPRVDIEAQLKALGIEHEKAIGGWRDQLAAQKAESASQLEQLRSTFSQQQQAYQTQAQRERADLESQLNLSFAQRFDEQQKNLTSKYEGLLGEAKTEAETARVKQAQEFEQRRLDQQAAWDTQSKAWETKDRVYQSQLGELKSSLGVQQDMYSGLQGRFGDLQGELGLQQGLYSGLQDQFGQAKEDWSKQQEGYQREIGDVKTSLAESQRQAEQLGAAVKRNEELAIQNAERARVSASYGSQGKPLNQPVKGVRTLNELTPTKKRYTGARGTFGRSGAALRISNLNI